ncbi:NAD(P)-dependent alcohol dehydrogenase [Acidipila sp. EB88]|uniref:zinc-dependent alcohol dehydrogenase family protein n=1 Tax=Acidipila sp. EB88 TaxID=2305226 RepID=UPI000F5DAB8E|nr:NAD(P)-dependent alcohol dehydrogenase [Acidipila sp. EB88]RRA48783.1 NAD(P)-dependent alcohol dehydrogenase [Acidipila sp. EB88]
MKLWTIPAFGIDQLALGEGAIPAPAANQVVVEVHAVSLNYRDLMTVTGKYNPKLKLPRIPLSDGAGVVHAVGDAVRGFKVGDRVAGIFMQNWQDGAPSNEKYRGALGGDIDGMAAQYVTLHQDGVVLIPDGLSFAEAATLPCAGVTAWSALQKAGGIAPGSTVLIQGTGGVSIAALQLAKAMGARVLGTSSSDEKLERARALGLDAGFNYKSGGSWADWAVEQTDGRGVDLVIEVGGSGTFLESLKACAVGGAMAQIGVLTESAEPVDVRVILRKQLRVQGIYVGSRTDFEALNRALIATGIKPVIDKEFALEELPEAFRQMEAGSHFGKLVVRLR